MLFLFQYPSLIRIQKIHLPSLFISGMSDALIPPAMMNELYEVCRTQDSFILTHQLLPFISGYYIINCTVAEKLTCT